jgi:hypothetical protein
VFWRRLLGSGFWVLSGILDLQPCNLRSA